MQNVIKEKFKSEDGYLINIVFEFFNKIYSLYEEIFINIMNDKNFTIVNSLKKEIEKKQKSEDIKFKHQAILLNERIDILIRTKKIKA